MSVHYFIYQSSVLSILYSEPFKELVKLANIGHIIYYLLNILNLQIVIKAILRIFKV